MLVKWLYEFIGFDKFELFVFVVIVKIFRVLMVNNFKLCYYVIMLIYLMVGLKCLFLGCIFDWLIVKG